MDEIFAMEYGTFRTDGYRFDARRTTDGTVELRAEDDRALAAGLGFAHGCDRMLQMLLVRLAGEGRLSECLKATDDALTLDILARRQGFARTARAEVERLSSETRAWVDAYCEGVNACLATHGYPGELKLLRYQPSPWSAVDVLLTLQTLSYLGMAQMQENVEKLIIEAVVEGVDVGKLSALFGADLDGLDADHVGVLRHVNLVQHYVGAGVHFLPQNTGAASNNWALAGSRTRSGSPMLCFDPHLQVNRLPGFWYETVGHVGDEYQLGITIPGVPGLVMGRTRRVAAGFTYGLMDMIDYFVEDVAGERVRRGSSWRELDAREEVIERKRGDPVRIRVLESDVGLLETDPLADSTADGLYLARAWTTARGGVGATVDSFRRFPAAQTVGDAQEILREVTLSCNWLLADAEGGIAYQQSGRLPRRAGSGLVPQPAWDERLHWDGLVEQSELSCERDPEQGYLATANNDLNQPPRPPSITVPMPPYRVHRIEQVLADTSDATVADMEALQGDLHSLQADAFMEILTPLIPQTPVGDTLRAWDRQYDADSRGATLFEACYSAIMEEVFGDRLFGTLSWNRLAQAQGILSFYYGMFDRPLLEADERLFAGARPEDVFAGSVERTLAGFDADAIPPWGSQRQVWFENILFQGTLPKFLGFDYGPVTLPGNRATIRLGEVTEDMGRRLAAASSYRCVTDLGADAVHTALASGASDRRRSPYYTEGISRWEAQEHKTLTGTEVRPPAPAAAVDATEEPDLAPRRGLRARARERMFDLQREVVMGRVLPRAYLESVGEHLGEVAPGREREVMDDIRDRVAPLMIEYADVFPEEGDRDFLEACCAVLATFQVLETEIGDRTKTIELLRHIMSHVAARSAKLGTRLIMSLPGEKLDVVERYFRATAPVLGPAWKMDSIRDGNRSYEARFTSCGFYRFFAAAGAPEVTTVLCAWDALWISAIDPARDGIEATRPTTIGYGGDACHFQFHTVEGGGAPRSQ